MTERFDPGYRLHCISLCEYAVPYEAAHAANPEKPESCGTATGSRSKRAMHLALPQERQSNSPLDRQETSPLREIESPRENLPAERSSIRERPVPFARRTWSHSSLALWRSRYIRPCPRSKLLRWQRGRSPVIQLLPLPHWDRARRSVRASGRATIPASY